MIRSSNQKSIPTLERPMYLLTFFSVEKPEWGLSDLANASGLPKASCLRALRALESYSLISKSSNNKYRLGARLLTLSAVVQESYQPRHIAHPYLKQLRDQTGQSAQWVVRDGREGIYWDVIEPRERVRLYITPGRRAPLYAGASTRLLLAFAPEDLRNAVLARRRFRYTANTPTKRKMLMSLLQQIQETWLAISFGELEPHSAELAAPILNAHQHVIAAISVAGAEPLYRDKVTLKRYAEVLNQTACSISRELGFLYPWKGKVQDFLVKVEATSHVDAFHLTRKG